MARQVKGQMSLADYVPPAPMETIRLLFRILRMSHRKARKQMQIVINISDDDYRKVQDGRASVSMMRKVIRNGTPLRKGHGRILDEKDILDTEDNNGGWYDLVDMPEYIAGVKAIIEADNGESEE